MNDRLLRALQLGRSRLTPGGVVAVGLLLILMAPLAVAEETERETPTSFSEVIHVELINVDLYVTDKNGDPVPGLKRSDFSVFENGEEVELSHFASYRGPLRSEVGRRGGEDDVAVAPGLAEEGDLAEKEAEPLQLVIFIDNANTRPFNRSRVLRRVRERVAELGKARISVVTHNSSLKVRLPFTEDLAVVDKALEKLGDLAARGLNAEMDLRNGIAAIADALELAGCPGAESVARQYASGAQMKSQEAIRALEAMIRSLAAIPGRKALLYVADGLAAQPGVEFFSMVQNSCTMSSAMLQARSFSVNDELSRLAARANSARVTFYPLDGTGARRNPGEDRMSMQESFKILAEETGGRAFLNLNNVSLVVEEIAVDNASYYSLAYSSRFDGGVAERNIEVKLRRPDLKVRYRRSFQHRSAEEQMEERLLAALLHGQVANPLGVILEPAQSLADSGSLVQVGIPLSKLTLLPSQGKHQGKAKLFILVRDSEGRFSSVNSVEVPIAIPSAHFERARGQMWGYKLNLKLREGENLVAVAVRDEVGREISILTQTVRVATGES